MKNIIEYCEATYSNKIYVIGIITRLNGSKCKFLIDSDSAETVKKYKWHVINNTYISTEVIVNNVKKELYLHNLIMNKLTFEGKGQKETIDHINRNPLDNRKCNLRLISQTEQNLNQNKKPRKTNFPEWYAIKIEDLPKHVYYVKARGNHGDGFCVEFKKDGKKIYNPYIRSKVLTIEQKLEKIKELLEKGYQLYPEYNPETNKDFREQLQKEYQEITN